MPDILRLISQPTFTASILPNGTCVGGLIRFNPHLNVTRALDFTLESGSLVVIGCNRDLTPITIKSIDERNRFDDPLVIYGKLQYFEAAYDLAVRIAQLVRASDASEFGPLLGSGSRLIGNLQNLCKSPVLREGSSVQTYQ